MGDVGTSDAMAAELRPGCRQQDRAVIGVSRSSMRCCSVPRYSRRLYERGCPSLCPVRSFQAQKWGPGRSSGGQLLPFRARLLADCSFLQMGAAAVTHGAPIADAVVPVCRTGTGARTAPLSGRDNLRCRILTAATILGCRRDPGTRHVGGPPAAPAQAQSRTCWTTAHVEMILLRNATTPRPPGSRPPPLSSLPPPSSPNRPLPPISASLLWPGYPASTPHPLIRPAHSDRSCSLQP